MPSNARAGPCLQIAVKSSPILFADCGDQHPLPSTHAISAFQHYPNVRMPLGVLPQELCLEILSLLGLQDGWEYRHVKSLRSVSRVFNRQVLRVYFCSRENTPPKVEEKSLSAVRYNNLLLRRLLQGRLFMSSADRESAGWEDRLSTVVCMVREQQTRVPHCRLSSSIWPIMPPQNNRTERRL